MSDSFGLKIGLEGEKEFKKVLVEINQSFKVLGSEMELVSSRFDRQDNSVEALTARNQMLGRSIDAQKQKITTLEQALENASESFGENDRRTQQWQIQLNKARASLNQMEHELAANEQAMTEMSDACGEADAAAKELADSVQEAGSEAEKAGGHLESLGGIAKGLGAALGAAMAAIAAAAVAAGGELLTLGDTYNQAVHQISATTGTTGAELEALGENAQRVYTHNFGENLMDVADGLSTVSRATGLMGEQLEQATEAGFALRDTFGYELQESARTANALMQNFGLSAAEAYDLIAAGAQRGADQNGDLLDILNEYSAQYAALGLSAGEFLTGLIQGSDAGLFSLDKLGDAVKEFNIRAKDGSTTTSDAFSALGMNAEEMMARFASGGDTAREAFFTVVSALNSMEDPIAKNTAAVGLFGTMYEDLEANVLPVLAGMQTETLELHDALNHISQVRYDNLESALEGTRRSIEGAFLPAIREVSAAVTDIFSALSIQINGANGDFGQISQAVGQAVGAFASVVTAQLPTFLQLGAEIIGAIGSAMLDSLPLLMDTAGQLGNTDALAGKIDLIVTKSVSRFARNTVDSLTTIRKLKEHGTECYFEKEGIYTFDGKGELLITIMSSLAQEESRSISENITWGQRKSFSDGKVHLPYKRFLGYTKGEDGRPAVVESEAEIVRLIYRRFLDGKSQAAICKELESLGIPSPGGKPTWSKTTVTSILQNEKYKGDALLQKKFTVDFLEKKMKPNEGEVPQYYVTGSHPAIIEPDEWDHVQAELTRRKSLGRAYSGKSIFSAKLVCEECGSFFGSKVWHSTDQYRRTVWQCNGKFSNEEHCHTPTLDADAIQKKFIHAYNQVMEDRKQTIADCELTRKCLTDLTALDAEIERQLAETQVIAEMVKALVKENASTTQSQEAYLKKYEALTGRYEKATAELERLQTERTSRIQKDKKIALYIREFKKLPDTMTDWDDTIWTVMVEKAIVQKDGSIRFVFFHGVSIII